MAAAVRSTLLRWTTLVPVLAALLLALTWGRPVGYVVVVLVAVALAAAVLAAVHHAEGTGTAAAGAAVRDPGRGPRRPPGPGADRLQPGRRSAMASIGLTIPAIAVASIWLDGPLVLGPSPSQIVLLAAFLFLAVNP